MNPNYPMCHLNPKFLTNPMYLMNPNYPMCHLNLSYLKIR
jgi:hypothetical protein